MGWKTFKEKFNIKHNVLVNNNFILIGSGYVSNLISINMESGEVIENKTFSGFLSGEYPQLKNASRNSILESIQAIDEFQYNLPVYTFNDFEIIEKLCEEYGYPNCTHDGDIMYENTFFKNREDAIKRAKENAEAYIRFFEQTIDKLKTDIQNMTKKVEIYKKGLENLNNQ